MKNLGTLLQLWPVAAAVAGGIWWAAMTQAELNAIQAYIDHVQQNLNNLTYTGPKP